MKSGGTGVSLMMNGDLQVREVAAEELEHGEGGRRRHGGRGQQQAAARAGRERRRLLRAGAGGGEERAQLAQPRQAARVERHRREEPRRGRRRERSGREDPGPEARRRAAEGRREAVQVRGGRGGEEEVVAGRAAVVGRDGRVRRERAHGPLDGGQPRGRGERGCGREQELPRLVLHRGRRLRRRVGGRARARGGGVELGLGGGARAGEALDERHEVPRLGVDDLGRGVVDDDRLPRLLLVLVLVLVLVLLLLDDLLLLQVVVPLRRDGRLPDLVRVLADGEPRRARALQLPAARRRAVARRRVHVCGDRRGRRRAGAGRTGLCSRGGGGGEAAGGTVQRGEEERKRRGRSKSGGVCC
ncbi:hypothetical protein PAHAL_1G259100 [Panicum hallii]|jgi:hypothetical protein|uniref:Uncharacterized protein n=1 Tax=Panicum hallii TaxID=206008 RepID=A0A2T8KWH0_9POAL|nr:hypothetical protein PAHAL_1G259100 [Panicum hallii]